MKVFWMLLVVLLVAAGVVAALSARPHVVEVTERVVPIDVAASPAPRATEAPKAPKPAPGAVNQTPSDVTVAAAPKPVASVEPAATIKASPAPAPTIDSVLGTKPEAKLAPAPAAAAKPEPKPATVADAAATVAAKSADGELVTIPENPKFPDAKLVKAKVFRKADGSLLIDDRFRVTGSGTEKDPYKLPWELMISTKDSYNPQLGLARLPQRVVMFDGKHVKLTGFTAFPLSAQSPKEMLVMLNQWDGCCIGVPPTAYDAIEVRLAKPGTPEDKLNTHGSVTGVFQVDPYETNGWLMGLYLMNEAHAEYDE